MRWSMGRSQKAVSLWQWSYPQECFRAAAGLAPLTDRSGGGAVDPLTPTAATHDIWSDVQPH